MSPFLMFDYAAPKKFAPSKKRLGVGEHPHRGFETVTIAFQGEVEHKDSTGNCGIIGPGDVQVMPSRQHSHCTLHVADWIILPFPRSAWTPASCESLLLNYTIVSSVSYSG